MELSVSFEDCLTGSRCKKNIVKIIGQNSENSLKKVVFLIMEILLASFIIIKKISSFLNFLLLFMTPKLVSWLRNKNRTWP